MRDPIWNSFREDYAGFDDWLRKCQREHRQCWVIRADGSDELAAVAIVKHEGDEARGAKTLKICSFKVTEDASGRRLGELLLKAVFAYARDNAFDSLFVTVWPRHQQLAGLFEDFGFGEEPEPRANGEVQFSKRLMVGISEFGTPDPLEYHILFGPCCLDVLGASVYFVPIQPKYHQVLFPDLQDQGALFAGQDCCANAIRKAYICRASRRTVEPGAVLLFYRSGDSRAICCIGVCERALRSSDADEVARFVLPRTVFARHQIEEMTAPQVGALAVVFRQCLVPGFRPVGLAEMKAAGVLTHAPQSISRMKEEHKKWLIPRIAKPP